MIIIIIIRIIIIINYEIILRSFQMITCALRQYIKLITK